MGDAEDRLRKLRRLAELREEAARAERVADPPGLQAVKLIGASVVYGCCDEVEAILWRAPPTAEELAEARAVIDAARVARAGDGDG